MSVRLSPCILPTLALVLSLASVPPLSAAGSQSEASLAADAENADASIVAHIRAQTKLTVARTGAEVSIRWELPDVEIRGVDLIRNARKEPKGRDRIASVSKKTIQYIDTVPDASATYWYWLKITLKDGRTVGVGPVPTPDATVWTP